MSDVVYNLLFCRHVDSHSGHTYVFREQKRADLSLLCSVCRDRGGAAESHTAAYRKITEHQTQRDRGFAEWCTTITQKHSKEKDHRTERARGFAEWCTTKV